MNRKTLSLTLFPILAFFALVLFAQFTFAANPVCKGVPDGNGNQVYKCEFTNPITSQGPDATLIGLLNSIVEQLMPFLIALLVFAIIVTGFRYVIAVAGGKVDLKTAKELFIPLLKGIIIIAAAPAIITAIKIFAEGFNKKP